ncbi:helix-turn-helix transcriptional regulator [Streptomyces sp. DSM 42041]|uniref:Helix-turn-helix transcriptional regulator n=1 Tax=Streptomyces hazeniae TaxID=3075538 RepID=A0ABU2NRN1_9ACTN|nr:helix-turn-helix transcriptional regulator [Streptomyces sp. DSM 42041]MDT0378893.1 helix-turn-helix transcriptional regulator [Streptomyces sp. DSM 42041]
MAPGMMVVSPAGQYFAEVLRLLRVRVGLSQNELGTRMNYTGAAVSAVETCAKPATDGFIDAAEHALDAGGVIAAAGKYLRLERYPEHFQGFVQLEQQALSVSSFCTQVIDGLLQTESYARAVLRFGFPPLEEEEVDALAAARVERRALLSRKPRCVINIVIEESALRRRLGGPGVMKEQYQHLLDSAALPHVTLQVMEASRSGHAGLQGPAKLVETPDRETLAYMEANGHSTFVSKPAEVGPLAHRHAMISRQALRVEESMKLIEQLTGEL